MLPFSRFIKRTKINRSLLHANYSTKDSDNVDNVDLHDSSKRDSTFSHSVDVKLSGFAKAFNKFTSEVELSSENKEEKIQQVSKPFVTLLRNSKLMQIGDPVGSIVEGRIFHIVEDDLYIDFGGKFYVVCPRPQKNPQEYVNGSRVRIRLRSLELSTKFLGSSTDMTLLEADGIILGPMRSQHTQSA